MPTPTPENILLHSQTLTEIVEEHRDASATIFFTCVAGLSQKLVTSYNTMKRKIALERAEMRSKLHNLEAQSEHLKSENASLKVENNSDAGSPSSGAFLDSTFSGTMGGTTLRSASMTMGGRFLILFPWIF